MAESVKLNTRGRRLLLSVLDEENPLYEKIQSTSSCDEASFTLSELRELAIICKEEVWAHQNAWLNTRSRVVRAYQEARDN